MSVLHRALTGIRSRDWFAVVVELAVLVLGIVLGLQAADWSDNRHQGEERRRYLTQLLADNDRNRDALRADRDKDRQAAADLAGISAALADPTGNPDPVALQEHLCRWFVQPDLHLQRATFQELVSSGNLPLLDQGLRAQLAAEDAAHAESQRLDLLIPAVQRGAEPIDAYRTWTIDAAHGEARCRFDISGMRRDARIPSMLAQLYRKEAIYVQFRGRELDAVARTRTLLEAALKD